ncbi:hypothetical protein BLA3211_02602 [Burkholderia aenigmatica]|uniref:Uncharacterized protein n=1 Tax=Burkholderia aenigmatica TaxID=2015348 RepID=A0A6J5IUJ2_9BURK|nr:hypothetical protein BLA3211_02602 [Burkholderia aenigmatica]
MLSYGYFNIATICSIEKRLRFMANLLLVQGQVCGKASSRSGPGFLRSQFKKTLEGLLTSPGTC